MDWMKILAVVAGVMMLFVMWPAYKHWSQHGPKAKPGDWQSLLLPLVALIGFLVLLVQMVR